MSGGSSRRGFFRELASAVAAGREAIEPLTAETPEIVVAQPVLTDAEVERYSRQLVLPEWSEAAQLALREASVLVVLSLIHI